MDKIIVEKGDILYDTSAREEHVVLEVHSNGYLEIQYAAMKRAELEGGKNIIHSSEVDNIHIKKLGSSFTQIHED